MQLNEASLAAINKGWRALIKGRFAEVKTLYKELAMVLKSTAPVERFDWVVDLSSGLDEWLSDRTKTNLKRHTFEIANKDWQKSIDVHKNLITDDRLGVISPAIAGIADSKERHWDNLLWALINNGLVGLSYDELPFFDAGHASGSNLGALAFSEAAYDAAVVAMMSQVGDDGEALDIYPTHCMVGPTNRKLGLTTLLAQRNAAGATNVNAGDTNLIVHPKITDSSFRLLDLSKLVKPFIILKHSETAPRWLRIPGDEHIIGLYGCDARGNAGYGLHQLAYASFAP